MELPYRKPLVGLLAGHFWDEGRAVAHAASMAAALGIKAAVEKIDLELGKDLAWDDADSLHAYREQMAVNAAAYLRAIQFCQLFGQFEWGLGILCKDVLNILGAEELTNRGVSKLQPKWYAPERLKWLREAIPSFREQDFEPELKRVTELRNAFLHDGGQVAAESNQTRFEYVTAFIIEHPSLARIENQEVQLTDGAMPHFEKWFGDAFCSIHGQVIERLNGMDWSIPEGPSHQEMTAQLGRLVSRRRGGPAKGAVGYFAAE